MFDRGYFTYDDAYARHLLAYNSMLPVVRSASWGLLPERHLTPDELDYLTMGLISKASLIVGFLNSVVGPSIAPAADSTASSARHSIRDGKIF
jgi:hypothetical protein